MQLLSLLSLFAIVASSTVTWAQQTAYGQSGGLNRNGRRHVPSELQSFAECDHFWLEGPTACISSTTGNSASAVATATSTFKNPLKATNGPDPYMVYSNDYYYLMTTTGRDLQLSRGRTLAELKASKPKVIYADNNPSRCCNVWAPEMHSIGGVWYIYYTAGPKDGIPSGLRIHVIKGSNADLWASRWSYAGRIAFPNRDVWSIDATVLTLNRTNYIVYSTHDNNAQCLFIAPLTSPTSAGNAYIISRPTYSWEKVGMDVNEGPVPLYHAGRTWIVYSGSYCNGTGYKLGRLEYTGGDPLNQKSWLKYSKPIFTSGNGNYQP
ncbi:hypothetical protein FRC17_008286 [Serendipita sp. 399]|nr:hypothetical protein FRC17_008286 [Serendipita sp. 399]